MLYKLLLDRVSTEAGAFEKCVVFGIHFTVFVYIARRFDVVVEFISAEAITFKKRVVFRVDFAVAGDIAGGCFRRRFISPMDFGFAVAEPVEIPAARLRFCFAINIGKRRTAVERLLADARYA